MRFDDRLATVLARSMGNAPTRISAWRQIVDLLAQRPAAKGLPDEQIEQAFAALRALRQRIPTTVRTDTARSLTGLPVSPALIAFYAEDTPAVAAVAIGGARLDGAGWAELLPTLPDKARELLAARLGAAKPAAAVPEAEPTPAVVAAPVLPLRHAPKPGDTGTRAEEAGEPRQLLWPLRSRGGDVEEPVQAAGEPARLEGFAFESNADGILIWTDARPRGCLVGYSLSRAAGSDGQGVDGQAAGAFRHRAPFRDARLNILGESRAAGEWRLSGVPFFDHADGRFRGYRGAGRRPRLNETASPRELGLFDGKLPADAMRQLVHELRTPLNAVAGFAEMIDGQFLGPAAAPYRASAAQIVGEARRLLSAVDDLDVAARIETQRIGLDPRSVDAAALLGALAREYGALAAGRDAVLEIDNGAGLWVEADAMSVDRMFARLLGASAGLVGSGELIAASLAGNEGEVALRVGRPAAIAGRGEGQLLDPGYTPDGEWPDAPLLGLGFTLRLVRNLALAARGRFEIADDCFVLTLPAAAADGLRGESQA